jgi:ribonuclease BN (tRNA processing enzyme)
MRIRLLGTGTPTPSLKRMSSSYLVELGDRKILFDCGPGAYHRLLESGVKPTQITDVFFTHLHYDHCLDYIRLVMTRWDQGADRIPELNVYGPAHIAKMTELVVGEGGIFGPDLMARTELPMSQAVFAARGGKLPRSKPRPVVREIKADDVIDCGQFRVRAGAVIHAQPILECFGYRLEADGASFAYSGATATCSCTCATLSAVPRSIESSTGATWDIWSLHASVSGRMCAIWSRAISRSRWTCRA